MKDFLQRISSRKFLTALAVQIASVAALFQPERASEFQDAAVRIAALVTLLLASVGYGKIQAALESDKPADGKKHNEPHD